MDGGEPAMSPLSLAYVVTLLIATFASLGITLYAWRHRGHLAVEIRA